MAASEPRHPASSARTPTFADILDARLTRRGAIKTVAAAAALPTFGGGFLAGTAPAADAAGASTLTFPELSHVANPAGIRVARRYNAQVLIAWGDPVVGGAAKFDVAKQTAAAQEKQFGYNNDFVAYMPLPRGSKNSEHGLLVVNHEYTSRGLMFPAEVKDQNLITEVELAAHGLSVVEIRKTGNYWEPVVEGALNRRITALSTEFRVAGPAAGHPRLRTQADPTGRRVIGTLNNCAGGVTPWGTVLSGEENFYKYFGGDMSKNPEKKNYRRYGIVSGDAELWHKHPRQKRFDLAAEPNEANRFGWVIELDPYDPQSTPVKRTSLGRIKHEGATVAIAPDGRVAVYMGDDEPFECVYKFVSHGKYNAADPAANRDLLDDGVLYAAKFHADGLLEWLPLQHGHGPLNAKNGFHSQADVLIETRRAAQLLGATPLDRPEDVEANPLTGRVYAMLTNNTNRPWKFADEANPRGSNKHGHILELIPPGEPPHVDHAATVGRWDVFLLGGNPAVPADEAQYHPGVSSEGWLTCPDNCAFDNRGRMWIATDGGQSAAKVADGIYACDTFGPGKALTRLFFTAPTGAELCGPCFTPDSRTFFVSVQHPGDGSSFATPSTRWPDFDDRLPPRPAVVAITRSDGGEIGT